MTWALLDARAGLVGAKTQAGSRGQHMTLVAIRGAATAMDGAFRSFLSTLEACRLRGGAGDTLGHHQWTVWGAAPTAGFDDASWPWRSSCSTSWPFVRGALATMWLVHSVEMPLEGVGGEGEGGYGGGRGEGTTAVVSCDASPWRRGGGKGGCLSFPSPALSLPVSCRSSVGTDASVMAGPAVVAAEGRAPRHRGGRRLSDEAHGGVWTHFSTMRTSTSGSKKRIPARRL